jgi:hypothetical protein
LLHPQGKYAATKDARQALEPKKAVDRNSSDPLALISLALYGQRGELDNVIAL